MMKNEKFLCLLLILPLNTVSSEDSILSSCSSRQDGTWNKQNVGINLRSWLKSVTTIRVDNQNGLKSMRYYPLDKSFGPYSDMEDLADFHDNPTDTNNETDEDENLEETDSEKGFTTIGHFENDIPKGFAWQWQSERLLEGFLFGKVNETGSFTGNDIIYIYPDFQTGLRGHFEDGFVVAARPVSIIGERCQDGIKEILTSFIDDTIWTRQISNSTHISNFPKIMDPHEKKSVFLGNSAITGGGEGIFARRSFMPGQLVSYFNGIRVTEDQMFHDNMTKEEEYETGRYYFGLGFTSPYSWGISSSVNLDIPPQYRSIVDYRTPAKLNSSMSVTNTLATRSGPGQVTGPAGALTGPAGQPNLPSGGPGGQPRLPPGGPGGGRPGPPLPRPILPRERGYLDKFVEFLVGDGPANRYALICRQCESHNGMALREEFEYIAFRCCYCYYWNPARKQRPVAPRLTPAAERPLPATNSSDSSGSDVSAPNSVPGSRRGSVGSIQKLENKESPVDEEKVSEKGDFEMIEKVDTETKEGSTDNNDTETIASPSNIESEKKEESNPNSDNETTNEIPINKDINEITNNIDNNENVMETD